MDDFLYCTCLQYSLTLFAPVTLCQPLENMLELGCAGQFAEILYPYNLLLCQFVSSARVTK